MTPRYTSRYITELREHLADLIERERASGLAAEQASERALVLMGTDTDLARATIERGAPRSLAARAPWATFVILPIVLWVAVLVADIASMIHLLWPVRGLALSDMPETYRALIALDGFITRYLVGLLLAAGCVAVAVRQRLTSGWFWVGLSLIALLTGIVGLHVHVIPPAGGHKGGTIYSVVALVYWHGRVSLAATLGAWALHAAVLFGLVGSAYRALRVSA